VQFLGVWLFSHSSPHWVLLVWWIQEHFGFWQPTILEDEDCLGIKDGILFLDGEEEEKEQFLQK